MVSTVEGFWVRQNLIIWLSWQFIVQEACVYEFVWSSHVTTVCQ